MSNARLHARERATAAELAATNAALAQTVTSLQRSMDIHDRLTRVAVSGEGQPGIAKALHELTGMPVAIEDRYGNLAAWAGPGQPDPYPKESFAKREHLLRRLMRASKPIQDGERLVLLASPRPELLGILALIDPGRTRGHRRPGGPGARRDRAVHGAGPAARHRRHRTAAAPRSGA